MSEPLTKDLYITAKKLGFPDKVIEELTGNALPAGMHRSAVYKMVDTCAAEFSAETPYFYSTYDDENEAAEFIDEHKDGKKTVIVFGAGPIRIGQGIEFDYASVHCVWSLKKAGYDVVIVNNNPETVSDRLRHRRPALFRAADERGCDEHHRDREAFRSRRRFRRSDRYKAHEVHERERRQHPRHKRRLDRRGGGSRALSSTSSSSCITSSAPRATRS